MKQRHRTHVEKLIVRIVVVLVLLAAVDFGALYFGYLHSPYHGWKVGSLRFERLTFRYPADWQIKEEETRIIPSGYDYVNIVSPDKTMMVSFGTGYTSDSFSSVGSASNIYDPKAIAVLGSTSYLTGTNADSKGEISSLNVVGKASKQPVLAKHAVTNSICQTPADKNYHCPAYIYMGMEIFPNSSAPIEAYYANQHYTQAKLILESFKY